ncbi:MAG: GGDEF domain-containing protein [Lachnospiraceae bacterium]|nr:GGDEF domain-containing protein [Lachnospiraceae bacterium]
MNDTYGHSAGDNALCDAAEIMKTMVDNRCTVFRYAGDEFIILMKTNKEKDVSDLEEKIRERTSAFNENVGRPYNIGFSIGHDKYDKENDDADSFFKKIDEAMYIDKARVHRERALTKDRRKT